MKCWSFNGLKPGGLESKKQKEADIPWFTWKAKRVLFLRARAAADRHQRDVGTRERERERRNRKQRCFNQYGVGIYTILQGGYSQQRQRLKFQTYKT